MTDDDLLTLCAFEEANLEPDDGVAAVVRVVLNRMSHKFFSDGTVPGTVFKHNQFSWAEWAMQGGKYTRVADTPEEVHERAEELKDRDDNYRAAWARVQHIVQAVKARTYGGVLYAALTDDALLYLNPKISHQPWATPDKLVCVIGHHSFYRR